MDDDAARADDDIASDGDTRQYAAVSAEPDVASDRDRKGVFIEPVSLFAVNGVVRGIEAAAWANEHIVAEGNLAGVKKYAVVIDEQVVSGLHVVAEADIDILFCADIFPDPVHDFAEDGLASRKIGRLHLIEFVTQIEAAEIVLVAAGEGRVVHQTLLTFFKLCHSVISQSQTAAPASDRRPCSRLRRYIPAG